MVKKIVLPFVLIQIMAITSCSYKLISNSYVGIQPWKGWLIVLKFNKDSTFTFSDDFGCNPFDYRGRWYDMRSSNYNYIVLTDTTKAEHMTSHDAFRFYNYKNHDWQIVRSDKYYPIFKHDTVFFLKKNGDLKLRGLVFERQKLLQSKDLAKRRFKFLKKYYIKSMGKNLFINTFGDGKSLKQAEINLDSCYEVPIPFKIDKGN